MVNNFNTNTEVITESNMVKINNSNNIMKTKTFMGKLESKNQNGNRQPKLKIVVPNADQTKTNGFVTKTQSPMIENHATELVNNPKPNKPIMGCSALLLKANTDPDNSLIVHELVVEKYNSKLNHYLGRMYHRKLSRTSGSEDDCGSDAAFSASTSNYSPMSISSIGSRSTFYTTFPDEKNGFSFPKRAASPDDIDHGFIDFTDDATPEEDATDTSMNFLDIYMEKTSNGTSNYNPTTFLGNTKGEITNIQEETQAEPANENAETTELSPSHTKSEEAKLSDEALLENLMKQLSIQNAIRFQVSKALDYCRRTKEFESSLELIEAEKILLVATCTKETLTREIQNVQDDSYEIKKDERSYGEVHINNLKFCLKDSNKTGSLPHQDFTDYFLVILTSGSTVFSSDVVVAKEDGNIHVDKNFRFSNLTTDFDISVCIYSMRVGGKPHQYQIQKSNNPTPKNIFRHLSRKRNLKEDVFIKPTSFSLCGKYEIRNSQLPKTRQKNSPTVVTLQMNNANTSCILSETFSMDIDCKVKLNNKISGFLTIGLESEQGGILWNRRWCALENSNLKYWNYPSEEIANPLESIDLNDCLDQQIGSAYRNICPRPRTLMLPIKHNQTIKRFLLSADTVSDLNRWRTELNYVLCVLSVWNCRE